MNWRDAFKKLAAIIGFGDSAKSPVEPCAPAFCPGGADETDQPLWERIAELKASQPTKPKILTGAQFITAVRKAMGITALGQRVIIDAKCESIVRVYIQLIGDDRLLQLDLQTLLSGADIFQMANPEKDKEAFDKLLAEKG